MLRITKRPVRLDATMKYMIALLLGFTAAAAVFSQPTGAIDLVAATFEDRSFGLTSCSIFAT